MQENLPGLDWYKWNENVDLDMYQRGLNVCDDNCKVVDPDTHFEEWIDGEEFVEGGMKNKGMRKHG